MFVREEQAQPTRLGGYAILPILCCMVIGGIVTGEGGVLIAERDQQP